MSKLFVSCGFGPGVATGVATKFAKELGLAPVLLARTQAKLDAAVADFKAKGIEAKAFACDFGSAESIKAAFEKVKAAGEISVVHYNAATMNPTPIAKKPAADLRAELDVGVVGMAVALTESAEALAKTKGTFLITGGGFASDQGAAMAAQFGLDGLALVKACSRSFAFSQAEAFKDKFNVRCVQINGIVKKSKEEDPMYNPESIAESFFKAYGGSEILLNH